MNLSLRCRLDDNSDHMIGETRKHDLLTSLVIPVLGIVATIVSVLKDYPYIAAASLGVVVLAVLSRYGPGLRDQFRRFFGNRRDRRNLSEASSQLRHYVVEFDNFVHWDDRLPNPYVIVTGAIQRGRTKQPLSLSALAMESPQTISRFRSVLADRCAQSRQGDQEIRLNFQEFHELLDAFHNGQLVPIFQNDADKLRETLKDQVRSELNAAREQYVDFLRRYRSFLRDLNGKLNMKIMPFVREDPKPL